MDKVLPHSCEDWSSYAQYPWIILCICYHCISMARCAFKTGESMGTHGLPSLACTPTYPQHVHSWTYLFLYVCIYGVCVCVWVCGYATIWVWRTNDNIQELVSPSHPACWGPELRSWGLCEKCFYPLSHFTSSTTSMSDEYVAYTSGGFHPWLGYPSCLWI